MSSEFNFEYNKNQDSWLWGSSSEGIGIYFEKNMFWGNIVIQNDPCLGFGPYSSFESAKENIVAEYLKARKGI